MIKTNFKAHPTMIMRLTKPYLFVLILPLIRAVVQYVKNRKIDGLLHLEIMAFTLVAAIAVWGWRVINISFDGRRIAIKKGILIKSYSVIDVSRLSSVLIKQNIVDYMLGCASCSISTEAGRPGKNDFDIKLRLDDAKKLYYMVYGEERMEIIKFSAFKIALLAATTSSSATGIIVGVPIINRASDLVGVAISDMLLDEINNVSSKFSSIFPPVVNTVTIVLLFAYGLSFLISFIKNINFKLKNGKNIIEIQTGLLARKKIMFRKSNVNNVCIEQAPLMRMFKKHTMRVSVGGYGDSKGVKAVIVPIASRNELKKQLKVYFKNFQKIKSCIRPRQARIQLNRFLLAPSAIALGVIGVSAILMIAFPYFDRLILFLGLVALSVDLYYGSVCYHNYKFGRAHIGDNVFVSGSAGLKIRELYCDKNRIGVIKLLQTPADRHFKTCKAKLIVRSESADSVKIKNVSIAATIEQINNTYNFKLNA